MSGPRRAAFVALMLALTAIFVLLGFWQVQRLGEKEALIATVAEAMDAPPIVLSVAGKWSVLDEGDFDYRPMQVTGRYVEGATVLVFTSLADPRGEHGGPGYWVMTPFRLEEASGNFVFINRGFVPQEMAEDKGRLEPMNPATGSLTLEGIARRPEQPSPFTPAPDAAKGIDWVRDPVRLAEIAGVDGVTAPLFIDLPAGTPGELPQGGETVVEFPNNHLGYALTWFGFALLTPVLLVFWLRRPGRGS